MTRRWPASLPLAAILGATLVASGCGGSADAHRGVTIPIHYSHFMTERVNVRAGDTITFTLQNDDPIAHEWIVGTEAVHERHRTGTEPFHDSIPTEVTIPALSTRTTTVTFHEPGDYQYICHLPGHEQYGMVGTVHVEA